MTALRKEITISLLPGEGTYRIPDKALPPEDRLFICRSAVWDEFVQVHNTDPTTLRIVASSEPLEELPNAINGKVRRNVDSPNGEYYFIQGLPRWDPEAWESSRYLLPGLHKWLEDFGTETIYFTITPLPEDPDHAE